jgi:hypothetical protein
MIKDYPITFSWLAERLLAPSQRMHLGMLLLMLMAPPYGGAQMAWPEWTQRVPGAQGSGVAVFAVASGSDGSVYLGGGFGASAALGTLDFGTTNLVSFGIRDAFLAKYDEKGHFQWVSQIGGPGRDYIRDLAVSSDGRCYAVGSFFGECRFGERTLVAHAADDVFLAAFSPQGAMEWLVQLGGDLPETGLVVSLDASGNPSILVSINATTQPWPADPVLGYSMAVVRFSKEGQLLGSSTAAGFFPQENAANPSSLGIDREGNYYVAGTHWADVDFGVTRLSKVSWNNSSFLAKYNSRGEALWAKHVGTGADGSFPTLWVDDSPSLLMVSKFHYGDLLIGDRIYSAGFDEQTAFLASLDLDGDVQWVTRIGGPETPYLWISDLLRHSDSSIYLLAVFRGRLNVSGELIGDATDPSTRLLVAKYAEDGSLLETAIVENNHPGQVHDLLVLPKSVVWSPSGSLVLAGLFSGSMQLGTQTLTATQSKDNIFLTELALSPKLGYSRDSGQLVLDWSDSLTGFYLETARGLPPAAPWARVPQQPSLQNGRLRVSQPAGAAGGYYRLRRP